LQHLQEVLRRLVVRKEGVPLHIIELALRRMRAPALERRCLVGCVKAEELV
jgi:hypothetical protein